MSAIEKINPKVVARNISAILMYMQDMGHCTQATMGEKLGMSPSMAGVYLNEAVNRGKLVIGAGKYPKQYMLPSYSENEKKNIPLFGRTGKNQSLTIYVDESLCNKLKALAILRKGSMYGGQGQLVAALIEQEFEKIPESHYESLAKLLASVEEAEELKGSIPVPVEWSE